MANMIPVPKSLDISPGNRCINWEMFKQSWQLYEIASGIREKPEEVRVATLLSVIGSDALQIYNAFVWYQGEEMTEANVLIKFEQYFKPKKNISYERYLFMSRKQKKDENIEDFTISLRNSVKNCDYGPLTDSLVRDAIIMGVNNKKIQECLLRENDPSLDKCIDIVRAAERAKQHVMHMQMPPDYSNNNECETMEVDKLSDNNKKLKCKFCGNAHRRGRDHCPAYGKTCHGCGGNNHFQSACLRKQKVKSLDVEIEEDFEIQ